MSLVWFVAGWFGIDALIVLVLWLAHRHDPDRPVQPWE